MAPAQAASTKPKRKRQRKRQASVSSESGSSSSSSEEEQISVTVKAAPVQPVASSSSEASSSSSEDESSEDERAKRKGRNGKNSISLQAQQTQSTPSETHAKRPYPSRSPSPAAFNPANVTLGSNPFPLLRQLKAGPILAGFVPGDATFVDSSVNDKGKAVETEGAAKQREEEALGKEAQFGEWWRARLVSEFEKELGGLAAEPGLTAPRLSLLLTSLTTLSSLHTTSSSLAASTRSIWLHDPAAAIDPLASLDAEEGAAEEWGKALVGGEGDVEVGAEGVKIDEEDAGVQADTEMEVDE